ncbi:MAG: ABC transporter ATP-binding protein [Deltaproteobacteria bacterium]|nr:ABC transporter ATP-binding protein [Deltaproteobacteria bacterium]
MAETLLSVENLRTCFHTEAGALYAVDDVSFHIEKGKTLGLVGESGCGKSVTSLSIMKLLPTPPSEITSGKILFKGRDLLKLDPEEMRSIRGNEIAMIFQEPMTSLNPVFTIGNQISEAIEVHQDLSRSEIRKRTIDMIRVVGIPDPEKRLQEYPHQLSGGMRQRVMIAMALSCNPELLIADEPSTALDVTIQAQILDLLKDLQKKFHMSILMITHDLGVIAETADHVAVMYAGKIVEYSDVRTIFKNPLHPYTIGLLESLPTIKDAEHHRKELKTIPGIVPDLINIPEGCRFNDRCSRATPECRQAEPVLEEVEPGHWVRCIHWDQKNGVKTT